MEYWVDGYNLVLRRGAERTGTLEDARRRLLRDVAALGAPVRVYFDARNGAPGIRAEDASKNRAVRCIFVVDRTADDAMAADLRDVPRGSATVVTDDRELRGRAKQLGAPALGVAKFLARVELANAPVRAPSPSSRAPQGGPTPDSREARLSPREVDEWMKIFGFENDGKPPPK